MVGVILEIRKVCRASLFNVIAKTKSHQKKNEVALGDLEGAEENYSTSIDLCRESRQTNPDKLGVRRCGDLYLLLLNRGTVRLNNGMPKEALADLQQASVLREQPDAVILQNLGAWCRYDGIGLTKLQHPWERLTV
jgi:tetratricopeptide (TPR) repeat protein